MLVRSRFSAVEGQDLSQYNIYFPLTVTSLPGRLEHCQRCGASGGECFCSHVHCAVSPNNSRQGHPVLGVSTPSRTGLGTRNGLWHTAHRKIQHLVTSFPGLEMPEEFWRTGSANPPALESIHLDDTPIQGLFNALLVGGEQSSYTAYPSLRAPELENINLGYKERSLLEKVLMLRAGCGVGIHTLRLAKCRKLMGDAVEQLQTTVAVDWDGDKDALTDADDDYSCNDSNSEYYDFDVDALSGLF